MTTAGERDAWIQVGRTMRRLYPLRPSNIGHIDENDLAHALARICRFGGYAHWFYSVAQHCVVASHIIVGPPEVKLAALWHDAAEACGLGDVCRPIKQATRVGEIEAQLLPAIFDRLGVPQPTAEAWGDIQDVDNLMLALESERPEIIVHNGFWDCRVEISDHERDLYTEMVKPWVFEIDGATGAVLIDHNGIAARMVARHNELKRRIGGAQA